MEAQARVSKPNSTALVEATETTLSLKEKDGLTLSFLMYRLRRPSRWPRFRAFIRGVKPAMMSTGSSPLAGRKVLVAPDAQRAPGDAVVGYDLGNGGVVVDHFQRPEAEVANVEGFDGKFPAALPAFEPVDKKTPEPGPP